MWLSTPREAGLSKDELRAIIGAPASVRTGTRSDPMETGRFLTLEDLLPPLV